MNPEPELSQPAYVVEDFVDAWTELLRAKLLGLGVTVPVGATGQEISFAYWNAVRRRIEPKPRQVLVAPDFSCPSHRQHVINELKRKFEAGEDVLPYLSNAIHDANHDYYDDRLLNDWDIHHLHLGDITPQNIVPRTDEVLFVMVKDSTAYFIAVFAHGNWNRQILLETVHKNWPEAIAHARAEGWQPDDDGPYSDEQVKALRGRGGKKPKTAFTYITWMPDGTGYIAPGGGYVATGLSVRALDTSNWYCNRVHQFQEWLEANVGKVLGLMRSHGVTPGDPPRFKFHLDADGFVCAVEQGSNVSVRFEPLLPDSGVPWDVYRLA